MPSPPHILILGAGLIGLSAADALLRRGARVTVVEQAADVMRGASFANSGMIHPSQACNWAGPANDPAVDAAVQSLALRSLDVLGERMGVLRLSQMSARPPGCLQIFDTAADVAQAAARLTARGIAADVRPASSMTFGRPALFFAGDRSGDARLYGEALARDIVARGGIIHTAAETPHITLNAAGAPRVIAGDTRFTPDALVVACGAQSADVLRAIGIDLPVTPVRGWAADFARPDGASIPEMPIMDAPSRSALTPFSDRVRLSGTWGEASVEPLLARWTAIAPALMALLGDPQFVWSGLRPVSGLGRPFIGPTPVPGLWVNAGHGHMGWTLCAGSGALLADMICDGHNDRRFALINPN
jgi:D-amino-acid dehydrogenase